jgi:hypothetical protein
MSSVFIALGAAAADTPPLQILAPEIEALPHRREDEFVDAHVRRQLGDEAQRAAEVVLLQHARLLGGAWLDRAFLKDGRRHLARAQRRGAQAVAAFLDVEGMRQRHHGGLARGVGWAGQLAEMPAGEGGDVDDRAFAACAHALQHGQGAGGGAVQVDGDDLLEGRGVCLAPVALGKVDAGAVDKVVDAPEPGLDG